MQEDGHRIVINLAQRSPIEIFGGVFHGDVEKGTVGFPGRVALVHVKPIEHPGGIDKPESLSRDIPQKGLGEIVFQSRHHQVECVAAGVDLERAHPMQISFYLLYPKFPPTEAQCFYFMEMS